VNITAFSLAQRYIGIKELTGTATHPLIGWWHSLCNDRYDTPDEVPWCSAFANGIAWELRLPRSKSAAARSWLTVGQGVQLKDATADFCTVILSRGDGTQPALKFSLRPAMSGSTQALARTAMSSSLAGIRLIRSRLRPSRRHAS